MCYNKKAILSNRKKLEELKDIISICYDLFDFLFVSNIQISSMSSVNSTVKFFGFLGFFGKIALLITIMVIKKKYGNLFGNN